MSDFNKKKQDVMKKVNIKTADSSHISINEQETCLQCEKQPCTFFCPTGVFYQEDDKIKISYERCIECGACPWGCPYGNIKWSFPPGGFGVNYSIRSN